MVLDHVLLFIPPVLSTLLVPPVLSNLFFPPCSFHLPSLTLPDPRHVLQPERQYGTMSQTVIAVWGDGRVEVRERFRETDVPGGWLSG